MRKFSEQDVGIEGFMGINAAAKEGDDDEYGGGTTRPPLDKKP